MYSDDVANNLVSLMVTLLRILETIVFDQDNIMKNPKHLLDIFYIVYHFDIVTEDAIRKWWSTILPALDKAKQSRIRVVLKPNLSVG